VSLNRGVSAALLGGCALALALGACTPAGPDPAPEPPAPAELSGWQTVHLPGGMTPATVAAVGRDLLVGGSVGSAADRAPALAVGPAEATTPGFRSVRLSPQTPYGKVAKLVSVTGDGSRVVALGAAHGGAHANFRWTIWTGTRARVVDREQTFETFGGQEAGTVLGVARDRRGPLVVGTWQGAHGPDGALWRAEGDRWVRRPTPTPLADTVDRQVGPRTVTSQPDGAVTISGSVIDLRDGVHQAAAVWRGSGDDWKLSELPDPGRRSDAWSTACAEASGRSGTCWSVGSREGRVAIWSAAGRARLPDLVLADEDDGMIALDGERVVAAVSTGGHGRLVIGHGDAWRVYTAPEGTVRAGALVGTRLYLVTGPENATALSVRDLADVLAR
jgi:hypothetical protein